MDGLALHITVVGVLGIASSLMVLTVMVRAVDWARRRQTERLLPACRSQVLDLLVDGVTPHFATRAERRLTIDLLLSHLALLRGSEADTITRYLEEVGYVDEQARLLGARWTRKRVSAAYALGRTRSPEAVPALSTAVVDPLEDVRLVAARSLAVIGTEAAASALAEVLAQPAESAHRRAPAMIADDLVFVGQPAVPALVQIALRGDTATSATAIRALGEIRDPAAVEVLVELLLTGEALDVRAKAAGALGKIGDGSSVDALTQALSDDAWQVRAQAAKALGRTGDPRSVPALESAMPDPSWWVRVDCGEALATLGEPGCEALRRLTRSSDRYAAEQAESALAAADLRRLRSIAPAGSAPRRRVRSAPTAASARAAS